MADTGLCLVDADNELQQLAGTDGLKAARTRGLSPTTHWSGLGSLPPW